MANRTPSENQIAASQNNGRKSRGPASETGKAKSSRNSLRHGVLASAIVIDGESRDRFINLVADLHAHFQPASAVEAALVENMAVCRWRQMRVWAMEKAGLNHEIVRRANQSEIPTTEDSPTRAALAFQTLCDNSRTIEVLGRYETRYDRQYNRALLSLNELRRKRGIALVA